MIHMTKKHFLAGVLALMMLMITTVAFADTGVVTASSLYLREGASSDTPDLKLLRQGDKVEIIGKSGNWYKVTFGKYTGYVYKDYISVIKDDAEDKKEDNTLSKGDSGTAVKQVQNRLKELGYYNSSCDGNFGNVTVDAVKAFQKKNGLTANGIVDEDTLEKLNSASAVKANGTAVSNTATGLKKGDKGTAVKQLQQRLKDLGYYKSTCDGQYGAVTVNAVKAFQKKNGLTADGVAGTTTLKKLNSTSAIKADTAPAQQEEGLKKGDKGAEVKKLQERLKALGYYTSTIDSEYGAKTVAAVKAFQKKNGLTASGVADAATIKKLNSTSAIKANASTTVTESTGLKKGDKGAEVKKLQERLKELGYYTSAIDSECGAKTVAAVKAFQKKNGLTADGVAGTATLKKLNSASAVKADTSTTTTTDGLKRGDKGAEVKKLQQRLKELGYYTAYIESEYGSKTVEAVKAFQKKNGLTADGEADAATLKKLNSTSAVSANNNVSTSTTLKSGAKGEAVKELQRRLKELGYYNSVIDGEYGGKTVVAVKAFQKKNGLTADGVAGSTTLKKLNSTSAIKADTAANNTASADSLKPGDKGDAVKKMQNRLKELGYYTSYCDGEYGAKTVEAVKAFQKKNGLTADGVAGSATMKKLNAASAVGANDGKDETLKTNQTLKSGSSGAQVKALQKRLKELGYYTTSIDSDYGYRTSAAVSDFQRANGLTVNGTANPATLRKLVSSSAVSKKDAADKETGTIKTERLDWFKDGKTTFPRKAIIQVKDVKTGLVFKAKVLYGDNHLDAEPLTAADTAILLKINGGVEFSWRRRPMLVKYNGHVYASSIYSEPHGEQTIFDNNFEGQFCLHFYGSMTHGTEEVKQDHQECVAQAMKATW